MTGNWRRARSPIWRLLATRRGAVGVLVIGSVLCGLTESGILAILAQSAAALVDRASRVHVEIGPLHMTGTVEGLLAVGAVFALVRLALQAVVSVGPARIAADVQAGLRNEVFGAFTEASWAEQSRDREGYLQEILTSQVTNSTVGVLQAGQLLVALFTFLVLVATALAVNVLAALVVLAAAAGLFAALRPLSRLGGRRAVATSRASIAYAGRVSESVRLAEEIHVFGVDAAQRAQSEQAVAAVQRPFFQMQVLGRLAPGVYQSVLYLLLIFALFVLHASGVGHAASIGAVVLLLVRAGTYGQQVQGSYQAIQQASPYLDRVQEARRRYEGSRALGGECRLEAIRTITFEAVSYGYDPNRPVLREVDFEVPSARAIGILGPSGAGKSTLVQILLGLRVPDTGRYLINELPAQEVAWADWRRLVAYVPQEPHLLHASVADNIRFLREFDDARIERAARLAGIHDEIASWPDGYDTMVGPRADAISGGQQQRISLARALVGEPQLLVLDEPTSALDPHSEFLIQRSLMSLKRELMLFIVAHRMSTLEICDQLIVLVDGQVQAFDDADRIRGSDDYYRSALALSTMSTAAMSTDR
jgi:ABC-type multidrug transport system fused ATPase/permease subunit